MTSQLSTGELNHPSWMHFTHPLHDHSAAKTIGSHPAATQPESCTEGAAACGAHWASGAAFSIYMKARAHTYWLCITLFWCFVLPFNQVWFFKTCLSANKIRRVIDSLSLRLCYWPARVSHTDEWFGGVGGSWKIQLEKSVWLCSKTRPITLNSMWM